MKLKIKLDNTYLDELGFNISPNYSIGSPQSKTYKVDVPFSNGSIDLTEAITGGVNYSDRTITFELQKLRPKDTWQASYHHLLNEFQGRKVKLQMPYDDDHYFIGRVEFSALDRGDYMSVKCTFTAEPYRLRNSKSVVTYEPPATETTYSLPNESMPTNPTITTTHETEIKQDTKTWVVGAGTHKLAMMFRRGMNEIKLRSMVDYNLIPVANRQFEGWTAQGGATVSVTKCPLEVFEDGYQRNYFGLKRFLQGSNHGVGTQGFAQNYTLKPLTTYIATTSIPNVVNTMNAFILLPGQSANSSLNGFGVDKKLTFTTDETGQITVVKREVLNSDLSSGKYYITINEGTVSGNNFKAWEDYTDAEKPAAYIETSGGTGNMKYAIPLTTLSVEQHLLRVKVKNIGSSSVVFRNITNTQYQSIQSGSMRDVSLVVLTPTGLNEISPALASASPEGALKFYAYNPEVYATSKRNRVTIEYQEGAL